MIAIDPDRSLDQGIPVSSEGPREEYFPDTASLTDSLGKSRKRPTIRLGFLGRFGKKVDKIDYYREVFATLDKAVQKLRLSRVFASTSIGFVTFEEMNAAVSPSLDISF